MGFDKNNFTLAVLLDVSKAFDTLDHHMLLHKLGRAGIHGAALSWLESYLSARTQMVSFRGTLSGQKQLCCGVPQGSFFGPVLYLVYANDISNGVQYSSIIQYADDTTLYLSGSSFEEVISNVNRDLYNLTDWMKANKLAISASKTQVIVFSKNSLHRTPNFPKVKIVEDILGYQDTVRLLGIFLDSGLTWKAHIDNVSLKISRSLYALNRMKHFFSIIVLKAVYFGLVHCHLTYGISLWGSASNKELNKLLIVQKRALRCIHHKPYNSHTAQLFKSAQIVNIFDLFRLENIKLAHRFLNHTLPESLSALFGVSASIHTHNTRRANCLHIPGFNSDKLKKSFLYQVPFCWGRVVATVDVTKGWPAIAAKLKDELTSEY